MCIYGNISCPDPCLSCVTDGEKFCVGGTLVLAWVPVPYDGCTGGRMTTMTKVAIDRLRPVTRGIIVTLPIAPKFPSEVTRTGAPLLQIIAGGPPDFSAASC